MNSKQGQGKTGPRPTEASDLARQYCLDFPDAASRTIARKLVAEHPELYKDVEHARKFVRYHRGAMGEAARSTMGRRIVPVIPPGEVEPSWEPDYVFPLDGKSMWGVFLADVHAPYHDEVAFRAAVQYAVDQKHTDFCVVGGDFVDCHAISDYVRDPRARNLPEEIDIANRLLDIICEVFDFVVYKCGNHERRLQSFLLKNAPQFVGLPGLTWPELLRAEERKMPVVHEGSLIVTPNLTILHGHEFGGFMSNPVNPARGLFTRAKANAIQGHFHQTSQHSEGTVDGRRISCWSVGCLCHLRPGYRRLAHTKWNHGLARIALEGNDFWVRNHEIRDGRVF